jgi:hypothetical protein
MDIPMTTPTAAAAAPAFDPSLATTIPPRRRVRPHDGLLEQLNQQSARKRFEAYGDIAWDAPEHAFEAGDPRLECDPDAGLGATGWYRAQPAELRSRLGLHLTVQQMRLGMEFESILSRGLLEFAGICEAGSGELRYVCHEVSEEMQHSLMFNEVIARAGLPVRGLEGLDAWGAQRVPALGRTFPELFFIHVLGGEAPIDHVQRLALARREGLHPLLRRVMQIHVVEEARHISFAKSYLRQRLPRLRRWQRWKLRVAAPWLLAKMTRQMLEPPAWLLDSYGVPEDVRDEALHHSAQRQRMAEGLAPVRELCRETGLLTRTTAPLWRVLGIWS